MEGAQTAVLIVIWKVVLVGELAQLRRAPHFQAASASHRLNSFKGVIQYTRKKLNLKIRRWSLVFCCFSCHDEIEMVIYSSICACHGLLASIRFGKKSPRRDRRDATNETISVTDSNILKRDLTEALEYQRIHKYYASPD